MSRRDASQLKSVVYGPVPSWRLGRSLGIDLVSRLKTCSFDCIYCQLGPTRDHTSRRSEFVPTRRVIAEIEALPQLAADFVTFSGTGEPTLAANLGEVIGEVKRRLQWPVAVLTNSSLLSDREVRAELSRADLVVAKLDAADEAGFRAINRPLANVSFASVLDSLQQLRNEYGGRLAIQVMFCRENLATAPRIAEILRELRPDEVQLNTPLRRSPAPPLSPAQMAAVGDLFHDLPSVSVYAARTVVTQPLDAAATAARRPGEDRATKESMFKQEATHHDEKGV